MSGLLSLVQWLSPAFPTGAFAYSHGLEWAISQGEVTDAASVSQWLHNTLRFGAGGQDAVLLYHSLLPEADHSALDDLARAMAPSAERLRETLEQGTALARTVSALMGEPLPPRALPVALGQAARGLNLQPQQIIEFYLHSFASNLVSVAVRFVPLGQTTGQQVLAALHPTLCDVAALACATSLEDIGTCAILGDIAAMRHETMDVRIYRT